MTFNRDIILVTDKITVEVTSLARGRSGVGVWVIGGS